MGGYAMCVVVCVVCVSVVILARVISLFFALFADLAVISPANGTATVMCLSDELDRTLKLAAGWTISWPLLTVLMLVPLVTRNVRFSRKAWCSFLSVLNTSACIISVLAVAAGRLSCLPSWPTSATWSAHSG